MAPYKPYKTLILTRFNRFFYAPCLLPPLHVTSCPILVYNAYMDVLTDVFSYLHRLSDGFGLLEAAVLAAVVLALWCVGRWLDRLWN